MTFHGVPVPYDGRDDWLEKRRAGVGASDVAAILGLSPWATAFTVWAAKTQAIENEQTEPMKWGKALEDVIAAEFTERTGLHVGDREMLIRHPKHEWCMATVDGLAYDSPLGDAPDFDASLGLVEIKTEGGFSRWDEIPNQYLLQCQWQLFVAGLDHCWVPVLHGGRRFEVYEVEADPGLQELILSKVTEFRETYLLDPDAEPPDPMGAEAETKVITDLWAGSEDDDVIELSAQMAADVESLRGFKAEKKRVEELVAKYEQRVKVSLQEATVGTVDGRVAVTWKRHDRKPYTRVVEGGSYRSLLIKNMKEED